MSADGAPPLQDIEINHLNDDVHYIQYTYHDQGELGAATQL